MTTPSPSLAVHLWPSAGSRVVRNIALVVLGCALLWVSAKVKVPFWPVPMTLQTFAVMALAAAYGARLGAFTVIAYLAAGAAGLPVFTNTPPEIAGPAYLLVIVFNSSRRVVVNNKPYVSFVYPHTECVCCNYYFCLIIKKIFLDFSSYFRLQPCMIISAVNSVHC